MERMVEQRTLRWAADQIELLPTSASLYEDAKTARAVTDFKKLAADLLREEATK